MGELATGLATEGLTTERASSFTAAAERGGLQRSTSNQTPPGSGPGLMSGQPRKLVNHLRIGSWNIRTLNPEGKLDCLAREMERYKLSCLGLSETRMTGKGHMKMEDGAMIIISGTDRKKEFGVGMILTKDMSHSLLGYNPIDERILTVRLAGKPLNMTLIQVYAPTNQATEQEKESFYARLQQAYEEVPKQDICIFCGDFNAKIGEQAPIGQFAKGERNDNGERLVQFAQSHSLVAANALVARPLRRLYTWRSADGRHRNQIDYFLVPKRWRSSICKCRSYPGADADTDHTLVVLKFGLRLQKLRKPTCAPRWDYSEPERFQLELRNRFERLSNLESEENEPGVSEADRMWTYVREAIKSTARATLRTCQKAKYDPWISGETQKAIDEKRSLKRGGTLYREAKRKVRSLLRRDKQAQLDTICGRVEDLEKRGNSKDMFGTVRKLAKQACPQAKLIADEAGRTLTEDPDIMARWKRYCENLYSEGVEPSNAEEAELQSAETDSTKREWRKGFNNEPLPTYEEVERAFKSMKVGKAVGPDEVSAELLKLGGETVTRALHKIIVKVWETGKWPVDWCMSTFIPLFKKGDPSVCANYRTISLISHASKTLLKVILERMRAKVESEVAEEQAGFRPERGTHNHLCNLRLITERARARRLPLFICFIDFEKAFFCEKQ